LQETNYRTVTTVPRANVALLLSGPSTAVRFSNCLEY